MAIGPVEMIVVDQHEPLLSRLMKFHTSVEKRSRAGQGLVDKTPTRDYFTGELLFEARQIVSEQTQADANKGAVTS